jgi:8-oxo-dGTP diphosphatase
MRKTRVLSEIVLLNDEGKTLVLRRSATDTRRPGQWDVPGGHVDAGEAYDVAAARELKEEAGISVEPASLRLLYTLTARREDINAVWLFFGAKVNGSAVSLSDEHSEYAWITVDDAIAMIDYELQKDALRYIRDNDLLETD